MKLTPEWSHRIESHTLTSKALILSLEASERERKDVARRLKIQDIEALTAKVRLQRQGKGNVIHVSGEFTAKVVQACIVTLDPVHETITETFESWFSEDDDVVSLTRVRKERKVKLIDTEIPIMEEKDDPEPVEDGHIDAAEVVTQHLSLSINPFPRAPGVAVSDSPDEPLEKPVLLENKRENPFAALKALKIADDKE